LTLKTRLKTNLNYRLLLALPSAMPQNQERKNKIDFTRVFQPIQGFHMAFSGAILTEGFSQVSKDLRVARHPVIN